MRNEPINYKQFHFESLDQVTNLPHDYLSSVKAIEVSSLSSSLSLTSPISSLSLGTPIYNIYCTLYFLLPE